jgi:predicted dehydrogenase
MIRIGFIGAGSAASAHLAALQYVEGVQVTAFADPVVERAQERAQQLGGALAVADLEALWDLVDAVWICSPPHLHAEHAQLAAQAGRHVFIERPIAPTIEAADQIIESCRAAGVQLTVGHSLRFSAGAQRLQEAVHAGELGDLVACWSRRFSEVSSADLPWWRRDWRRGGGLTIEWGCQEVDFLRWLGQPVAGPLRRVHGRVAFSRRAYPDFDDFVRATLVFESGAIAGFEGSLNAPLGGTSRGALGTRAMAIAEGRTVRLRYTGDGLERLLEVPPATDPERRVNATVLAQAREFIRAIEEQRPPAVTGEEARAALAICLAIHQSSREQREIDLG